MIFDGLDPIVVRFSEVEKIYVPPRNDQHQLIIEVAEKALKGIQLTFREEEPFDFDLLLRKELERRFRVSQYESVFFMEQWLLKREIVHRVDQCFTGVDEVLKKRTGTSYFPGAERIVGSYHHRYNNLFRVVMNTWLEEVNRKHHFEVVVPREYLVPLPSQEEAIPDNLRYFIVAEKLECFEGQQVVDIIQAMPLETQKLYIDYLASWIHKSGFLDCHFKNIGLSKTETMDLFGQKVPKFVVIDSEPFGLITEEMDCPQSQIAPGVYRERLKRNEAAYVGLKIFQKELKEKRFLAAIQRIADGWVEEAKAEVFFETKEPLPKKRSFRFWSKASRS